MKTKNSNTPASDSRRVAVFGLGYVGCVTAACLAETGSVVVGVDRDEYKVQAINAGRAPFHEPGLEDLVAGNLRQGRLSATVSIEEALSGAEIALICVGTPSQRNGNLGLEQLERVCAEIREHAHTRTAPLTVAIRSTVFPGTCAGVVLPALAGCPCVRVVANPEFLREGAAVRDFMEPSLIVVGGDDPEAVHDVAGLYGPLELEPCLVSLGAAEMIKYACNAFHAVKIGFANEIGVLAAQMGISGDEVMQTLCRDEKLNVSAAYLQPGFAFGGSCLPKDLRALVYRVRRLDLRMPLLESVLPSNDEHLRRGIASVMDLPVERIGVYGLAFKADTDDLRESPVVGLIEQLIAKGRAVRVFDPVVRISEIYGSNQRFVLNAVPHISRLLMESLDDLLGWAEYLVVAQPPRDSAIEKVLASRVPVLNLVGRSAAALESAGVRLMTAAG
jgi:GDP-mannose 6-dehydrogenase